MLDLLRRLVLFNRLELLGPALWSPHPWIAATIGGLMAYALTTAGYDPALAGLASGVAGLTLWMFLTLLS